MSYSQGRSFEWKVRADLEANGYEVVRAAGSKGGTKADLLAFKPGQLLMVQAKRSGALPAAEWDRLVEVAAWITEAVPVLAANGPNGRGVIYTHLLAPKVPRARLQPARELVLDQLATPPAV